MIVHWNKILLLGDVLLLIGGVLPPASGQEVELPDLTSLASDSSGMIVLFYPADWIREGDEREVILSQKGLSEGGAASQIILTAEVVSIGDLSLDELAAWLIERQGVPERAAFSVETYAGYEGWLAQGRALFEQDVFSARVILPLGEGQGVLIRSDFPLASLSRAASVVTAMLEQMVILPKRIISEDDTLQMRLPSDWLHTDGMATFLTAPDESNLQQLTAAQVPSELGVSVRFLTNTTAEALLSSPTAVAQDRREINVDGVSCVIQLQQDNTLGSTELILLRQRSADTFIELRAISSNPDLLLVQVPLLQAMFASVRLR